MSERADGASAAGVSVKELMISVISSLLQGCRHVAVGASSPIPGAGALLAQSLCGGEMRVSVLGSRQHNFFTDGGVELFDCASQGRIDAFFLGGGEIDGQANINLVGVGGYPNSEVRWPGCFGSAYLYLLVPRVILFREEHSRRVMVEKVSFVSAAGPRDENIYRPGGPYALLTNIALFRFDTSRRRFRLMSIHPGHTLEEVLDLTGFAFDRPEAVPETPLPDAPLLSRIRGPIRDAIGETYPRFVASVFPAHA